MWKEMEPPRVEKLTQALAKRFSEMEAAPHDRALKQRRCDVLDKAVKHGTFRTCEWASAVCKETNTEYRVNGKHTSTMFAEMNGSLPKGKRIIVERYECDTLEDVASLYATFDTRISLRSTGDINRLFAAAHKDLAPLPVKVVNVAVSGMSYATWGEQYYSQQAEDRAALMLSNPKFVVWMSEILHGESSCRHLYRGPAAAAMFLTFNKAQQHATDFWTLVRDASGKTPKDPDRVLNRFLLDVTVASGRGLIDGKKAAPNREVFVKCLHAWNAHRTGTKTKLAYYADAPIPAVK